MHNELQADNYVQTLRKESPLQYACRADSAHELEEWQAEFRPVLRQLLGLPHIQQRAKSRPVAVRSQSEVLADHIREEWSLESEPGYCVPFYLLRPRTQAGPLPLVLTPHGHGKAGKDTYVGVAHSEAERRDIEQGERDIALQAVHNGFIAIAPDQRGFAGTRLQKDLADDRPNSCRTMQMHALLFGRTLVGERVWDLAKLIDFATTQEYIDATRIIVTGNSGGGTVSLFAGAVDTRISIVIPGSYFCSFAASIGSIYHCECNYIPGILHCAEMVDVAGLIAPRPFLAVNGKDDPIFPIEATKAAFSQLQRIYRVVGAEDRCELYVGHGGHRYYQERVWPFVSAWKELVDHR